MAALVDTGALHALEEHFAAAGSTADTLRLRDLRDPTVSSDWMWTLDPRQEDSVEPASYVAALRLRLGAGFAPSPAPCRVCWRALLDHSGSHALCCASGPSTHRHNEVCDALHQLACIADTTAEKEVSGLVDAAPGLRPADVLTSAASPGLVSALDVGVACPHAQHAGPDCLEAMQRRKQAKYREVAVQLEQQGVEYRPILWSCWGREHADTTAVLTQIARRAARRGGFPDYRLLLRRARGAIGAALARRAAAMLRACAAAPAHGGAGHGPFTAR